MKKLVMLACAVLTLTMSFLVLNLFGTNEINRINHIEDGFYTTKFFPSGSNRSSDELLEKFDELSNKYQVSFVKTDQDDVVTKSVVLYEKTFPAENFGLETVDFPDEDAVYASFKTENQVGEIKTFLDAKLIRLMLMSAYFKDGSHSVNGSYSITSTYSYDKYALLADLADFFETDVATLTEQKVYSVTGYVNQNLIISLVIIAISCLILIMATVYQPLVDMKKIGVKKLLGFTNRAIFLSYLKPSLIIILALSATFDLACLLCLDTFPQYFFLGLIWGQLLLTLGFALLSMLVYTLIQQITVGKMLKGFLNFRLALWLNYLLKLMMSGLVAVFLFFISQTLTDMQSQLSYQTQWKNLGGNFLTMEYYKPSSELQAQMLAGEDSFYQYFGAVYEALEVEVGAQYIRSEQIDVAQRFESSDFESLEVMYVNRNYLKSIQQAVPVETSGKLFLVSSRLKSQEAALKPILQQIYHQLLSYEEQESQAYQDLAVTIHYYDADLEVFPYHEDIKANFKNPIFVVTSENLLYEEQAYLANTGVSNPMKIKNSSQNLEKIQAVMEKQGQGTELKFSSLYEIQESMIDSLADGVKNFSFLVGLLVVLNMIVSYFMVAILFICQKQFISTVKLLGWTLLDRYRTTLVMLGVIHLLTLALAVVGGQLAVIMGQVAYLLFDVGLIIFFLLRQERKNLSQELKAG